MEPAASIIKKLGGYEVVAQVTGTAITAPYRWTHTIEKGGTGGFIPRKYHQRLLDHAKATEVELRPEDFVSAPSIQAAE